MKSSPLRMSALGLFAAGLLVATAPLSASAHTGSLFMWAYTGDESAGFASVSKTDAALTLLEQQPTDLLVVGAEICEETGYAVADDPETVLTWNHTTGVPGPAVDLVPTMADWPEAGAAEVNGIMELDTLADCTLLAIALFDVWYEEGDPETFLAVSVVNPVTGVTSPVALLDNESDVDYRAIATDPITGVTYLFLRGDDGLPYFSIVDVVAGTVSAPTVMAGVADYYEGEEFQLGSDFDSAGVLWAAFGVAAFEEIRLVALTGPAAALGTTVPSDRGEVSPLVIVPYALAVDPDPALAATGLTDSGLPLLGAVLLGAGMLAVVVAHRPRRAAR